MDSAICVVQDSILSNKYDVGALDYGRCLNNLSKIASKSY